MNDNIVEKVEGAVEAAVEDATKAPPAISAIEDVVSQLEGIATDGEKAVASPITIVSDFADAIARIKKAVLDLKAVKL